VWQQTAVGTSTPNFRYVRRKLNSKSSAQSQKSSLGYPHCLTASAETAMTGQGDQVKGTGIVPQTLL
jgi:hypothetical protein